MFGPNHYVPILRSNRGERTALRELFPADRARMTPLLELVPKAFHEKNTDQALKMNAKDIAESWGFNQPVFFDTWLLDPTLRAPNGVHPIAAFAQHARNYSLRAIPVVRVTSSQLHKSAVRAIAAKDGRGACLRLGVADVEHPHFLENLASTLDIVQLAIEDLHLLIDYQVVDGFTNHFLQICNRIPDLCSWKTFTFASGAFPKDLSGLEKNSQHVLERWDFLNWRDEIAPKLLRRPAYGDYTVQHGTFSPPPQRANYSASIRYTTSEHWVIMRGESVFRDDGPGFAQWPANAQLLCDRPEFAGSDYSFGDKYIYERGSLMDKDGTAESWICAGINHHLTYAARQVAS